MAYTGKKPVDHTDVTQSQSMTVTDDLTVDTNTLHVDSTNNRVGIGTTSPTRNLHVNSGTGDVVARFESTDADAYVNFVSSGGEALVGSSGNDLVMYPAGTERMRITSTGLVGIGTSSPSSLTEISGSAPTLTLDYDGDSGTSSRGTVLAKNDDGTTWYLGGTTGSGHLTLSNAANANLYLQTNSTTRMAIAGTGDVTITGDSNAGYVSVIQAYIGTTSGAANLNILSSGVFLRSTSSGRYKTGVEDAEMSYAEELYNLRPVYYKSLGTFDNPDHSHWGFIAEEVAEIDPRLCLFKTTEPELDDDGNIQRDDDGNIVETTLDEPVVEGVQYDRMIPLLLMLLKEQKQQIEDLEARVATLEGN